MRHLVILIALGSACIATPLPHPPTLDPELVTLADEGDSRVRLEGASAAAAPAGLELRVTWTPGPSSVGLPERYTTAVGDDGSFGVAMVGSRSDHYFIEAITDDEDLFLAAVTGGPGRSVEVVDDVSDSDDDGSPDEIDCAPDDPTVGGRRCR